MVEVNLQKYLAFISGLGIIIFIIVWHEYGPTDPYLLSSTLPPPPATLPHNHSHEHEAVGNFSQGFLILDRKLVAVKKESGKIPKILHQTWKSNELPDNFVKHRATWQAMHNNWTQILWSEAENREIVEHYYPWFLGTYDAFPVPVMRTDTVRYLYMHRYGGMYADLDMEPLRPLDFLIDDAASPITLSYMSHHFQDKTNIPPDFLISEPGHQFWLVVLMQIKAAVKAYPNNTRPEFITGSVMFYKAIQVYSTMQRQITGLQSGCIDSGASLVYELNFIEPGLIYPYHWNQEMSPIGKICSGRSPNQDEAACKSKFPNAYTIQYSSFAWQSDWEAYLSNNSTRPQFWPDS